MKARLDPKLQKAERSLAKHRNNIQRRIDHGQRVNTAALKSGRNQIRLMKILGLTIPERWDWAAEMLSIAGYAPNGLPLGLDYSRTKFMTDTELRQACKR